MSDFNKYFESLQSGLQSFARESWQETMDAALSDAGSFLNTTKDDLSKWTQALAKGDMSKEDFAWLVASKKDVAALFALKQIGLKKVALDRFMDGVVNVIVDTAFKTFL